MPSFNFDMEMGTSLCYRNLVVPQEFNHPGFDFFTYSSLSNTTRIPLLKAQGKTGAEKNAFEEEVIQKHLRLILKSLYMLGKFKDKHVRSLVIEKLENSGIPLSSRFKEAVHDHIKGYVRTSDCEYLFDPTEPSPVRHLIAYRTTVAKNGSNPVSQAGLIIGESLMYARFASSIALVHVVPETTFVDWKVPESMDTACEMNEKVQRCMDRVAVDPEQLYKEIPQRVVCVPTDPLKDCFYYNFRRLEDFLPDGF